MGGCVVLAEEEGVEGEGRRVALMVVVGVAELFSLSLRSSSLSPSNASGTGERLSSSLLLGGYVCV
jgi:hypothetical protein